MTYINSLKNEKLNLQSHHIFFSTNQKLIYIYFLNIYKIAIGNIKKKNN